VPLMRITCYTYQSYSRNVGQMQRRRRRVDIVVVLGVRSLESVERRVAVVLRQS